MSARLLLQPADLMVALLHEDHVFVQRGARYV
jgi:hypothetical protein